MLNQAHDRGSIMLQTKLSCDFAVCWLRSYPGGKQPTVSMYNFGSPRVGNATFVQRYDRLVPDSWRVFNPRDLVCNVPRLMGYAHVGHPVEIRADGTFTVMGASLDLKLG